MMKSLPAAHERPFKASRVRCAFRRPSTFAPVPTGRTRVARLFATAGDAVRGSFTLKTAIGNAMADAAAFPHSMSALASIGVTMTVPSDHR
jgi:hypothetical protein